ncbi:hypothetical protein [Paenibacillus alginolyticus]|uniref:Uncharacterized protein n=1 Tax=Paenibacillus alginolyticus TaxID=59839 RepID=A0ABT4GPU5_9BACL|nr:hypothetical protein [Paenibacillus alginolyticus]MCY9698217.1 hypothetical protein [Paenibacillus alginolyticus]MEC0143695.1 hypothetical protein [Paenibacillus alginolyticus]
MKIRGKRRYYRSLKKMIQNFSHHLSEETTWYNMWHMHFDEKGITENVKDRRSHIKHYIELLRKIKISDLSNAKPFQTWIFLDSVDPTCDALYLHTSNPYRHYPFINQTIFWLNEEKVIPELLKSIVKLDNFEVGEYKHDDGRRDYFIRMANLGMSLKD